MGGSAVSIGAIPPAMHRAADLRGKEVGLGLIECRDVVEYICERADRYGYKGDLLGLRTRIYAIVRDSAEAWRIKRIQAEYTIRKELAPLLDARARSTTILDAAHAHNRDLGGPFLLHEIRAFVEEEMLMRMRPQRQRRRSYGR
jgi:hypothetical protein